MKPGLTDYALLGALALIWGGSFMLVKVAIDEVPPVTLTALRVVIGAVMFWAVVLIGGYAMPRSAKDWLLSGVVAITGFAAPFTLISWGMETTEAGLSAILMAGMPIFAVILAHYFVPGDRLNPYKIIGVLAGLVGVVVLIGPETLASFGEDAIRQLALLGAAFSYAVNSIVTKYISGGEPYALSAAILTAASLMLVPAAFWVETPMALNPGTASIIAVILLGVFPTAIATVLMLALLRRTGPSFFSQINFLVPISGVIWGMTILAERPGPNAWIALVLILAGIAIARRGDTVRAAIKPSLET